MILLDTHVLVWLAAGDRRLGRRAAARIDAAVRGEEAGVSAISFWEIETLVDRGRLRLRKPTTELRAATLSMSIREVGVDGAIGILAAKLRAFHGDPADRLISATALELGASLVTADETLLGWRGGVKLIDATK